MTFEEAVEKVRCLLEEGAARLMVQRASFDGVVRVDLSQRSEKVKAALDDGDHSWRDFREHLTAIEAALGAVVQNWDSEDLALRRYRSEKEVTEAKAEIEAQMELVSETFDIERLKHRYRIKRTSKIPTLAGRTWEVVSRDATSDRGEGQELKESYGILRLAGAGLESPLMIVAGEGSEELVLAVDVEDLDALIESLTSFKSALSETDGRSDA